MLKLKKQSMHISLLYIRTPFNLLSHLHKLKLMAPFTESRRSKQYAPTSGTKFYFYKDRV